MDILLSNSELYILLSLAVRTRHGYDIMKQVEQDSYGKIKLGPGTLYGSIKRMLESRLIEEVLGDNPRRKYYTLTEKGVAALSAELERYDDTVKMARRQHLLGNRMVAYEA